jgi:hypothetical protein
LVCSTQLGSLTPEERPKNRVSREEARTLVTIFIIAASHTCFSTAVQSQVNKTWRRINLCRPLSRAVGSIIHFALGINMSTCKLRNMEIPASPRLGIEKLPRHSTKTIRRVSAIRRHCLVLQTAARLHFVARNASYTSLILCSD